MRILYGVGIYRAGGGPGPFGHGDTFLNEGIIAKGFHNGVIPEPVAKTLGNLHGYVVVSRR